MTLAELIQKRLDDLGISKAELARLIGVSRSYVVNMANQTGNTQSGQYRPSPEVVQKLVKHLQVSEDEILLAIGYKHKKSAGYFSRFDALSPDKQRIAEIQIKAIIDALADTDTEKLNYVN